MKTKTTKKMVTTGLAVIAIGAAAFMLSGCGKKAEVELMDYVTVDFSGLDGQGTAEIAFDNASLEMDVFKVFAEDKKDLDDISLEETIDDIGDFAGFESSIKYELDKTEGLTNGDQVTVTISYDKEATKDCSIKVTGDMEKTIEVEGLQEPIELDAFDSKYFNQEDGIEVTVHGVAPFAYVSVENKLPDTNDLFHVQYSVDETADLKNGDTVTVTAKIPSEFADAGYVLKENTTTLTVEGVDSYVSSLTSEMWEQLKPYCDQALTEELDDVFYIQKGEDLYRFTYKDLASIEKYVYGPELSVTTWRVHDNTDEDYPYNGVVIPYSVFATMTDGVKLGVDDLAGGYIFIENLIQDENGVINTDEINVRISDYSYTSMEQAESEWLDGLKANYDFAPFTVE